MQTQLRKNVKNDFEKYTSWQIYFLEKPCKMWENIIDISI